MSTSFRPVKRLRDTHAEATRLALLAAARARFSEAGFAHTSLDDIAGDAGTTKGAVYHHFKDKKALFHAVYEALSQELIAAVASSRVREGTPADVALYAFLIHAGEPAYQRVLFKDGPVVLGTAECRVIDMRYSLGLITRLVEIQAPADLLAKPGSGILAQLLLALLVESAQLIASSSDPAPVLDGIHVTLDRMIRALSEPPR